MPLKYYDIHISISEATEEKAHDELKEVVEEILHKGIADIRGHADSAICDPPIPYTYVSCQYRNYPKECENDYIRSILESDKQHPKTENDLDGGVKVEYKGKIFITGNRRHDLVDLYQDGKFIKCVKIEKVTIL